MLEWLEKKMKETDDFTVDVKFRFDRSIRTFCVVRVDSHGIVLWDSKGSEVGVPWAAIDGIKVNE